MGPGQLTGLLLQLLACPLTLVSLFELVGQWAHPEDTRARGARPPHVGGLGMGSCCEGGWLGGMASPTMLSHVNGFPEGCRLWQGTGVKVVCGSVSHTSASSLYPRRHVTISFGGLQQRKVWLPLDTREEEKALGQGL